MAFVDMDSAQFYQPPKATGMRKEGRPTDCNLRPYGLWEGQRCYGSWTEWKGSKILQNFNVIETLDMTGPLSREPSNSLHMSVLNFNGTEADIGGTFLHRCLNRR